jgi:hypothetical protein
MKVKVMFAMLLLMTLVLGIGNSQNTRIRDNNNIGWLAYFGTFKLDNKWSIHSEFQFRRENGLADDLQNLYRVGVNYQLHPKVQLRAGGAFIETAAYGDIPINGFGKSFGERRMYQMVTLNDEVERVGISHRFLLEQRWNGKYSNASLNKEDIYAYTNRFRYMLRTQVPLKGKKIVNGSPYFAVYDEVFVGFGKNVGENIFDQNRLGILFGYRINDNYRIEGGFLNQIVQLGREVNGRNVFQNNTGFVINFNLNLDFSKKPK